MNTKHKFFIFPQYHPFSAACMVAVTLLCGGFASSAQTGDYQYTGSEQTITLSPGYYDITAFGAQGGSAEGNGVPGGLGAEMEGQFNFAGVTTLTILVAGAGVSEPIGSCGGGGGSFVVNGSTPLVIAGGGGGAAYNVPYAFGGKGGTGTAGGTALSPAGPGGGIGGTGGGGGGGLSSGGGGSIIDSSAIEILTEVSGIASPDDSPNGEIIITAVPEPATLTLAGLGGLSLLLFRRQRNRNDRQNP